MLLRWNIFFTEGVYRLENIVQQLSTQLNIPKEHLFNLFNYFKQKKLMWDNNQKKWLYPEMGDSQRTCEMLNVMFRVEHNKGIIIFIPFKEENLQ